MSFFSRWMGRGSPKTKRLPTARRRLAIDVLEDRLAPATLAVTTRADVVDAGDGKVSLREAITLANATAEADTITLKAGYYQINIPEAGGNDNTTGDFDITNPVRIRGEGKNATYISGEKLHRVFDLIGTYEVTFAKLTITNGVGGFGGGIQALTANITLRQARVSGNTGLMGAGINAEEGSVTLIKSSVVSNRANDASGDGGGIRAGSGTVTLIDSSVNDNFAARDGGGIWSGLRNVELTGSTVRGNTAAFGSGGGIYASPSTIGAKIILITCEVSGNRALTGNGGGAVGYYVYFDNTTVSGNSAYYHGGGIWASRFAQAGHSSTVHSNSAGLDGGGIWANDTVYFHFSTVHDNTAARSGGGVYSDAVYMVNTTVSGNSAGFDGGGIYAAKGIVRNVTVADNAAGNGGGVFRRGPNSDPLKVENTIIAGNSVVPGGAGHDAYGDFLSEGHNLISIVDGSTGLARDDDGSLWGTAAAPLDALLGPLANNGGPTLTHALRPRSPAIDAGNNTGAPTTDQRGVARPKDGDGDGTRLVDIGAFEK